MGCLVFMPGAEVLASGQDPATTGTVISDSRGSIPQGGDALIASIRNREKAGQAAGSISLSLEGDGAQNKSGVVFAFRQVALFEDGRRKMAPGFAENDLEKIDSASQIRSVVADLSAQAQSLQADGRARKASTDTEGNILLEDVPAGLYLIYAIDTAVYGEDIEPMLVSVPVWNETVQSFSYDVRALPKHSPKEEHGSDGTTGKTDISRKTAPDTAVSNNAERYAKISIVCSLLTILIVLLSGHARRGRR